MSDDIIKGAGGTIQFIKNREFDEQKMLQARNLEIVEAMLRDLPEEMQEDAEKLKIVLDIIHDLKFPAILHVDYSGGSGAFFFANMLNLRAAEVAGEIEFPQENYLANFEWSTFLNTVARIRRVIKISDISLIKEIIHFIEREDAEECNNAESNEPQT